MVNRVRSAGILLVTGSVFFILSFGLEAIGLAEARAFETVLMLVAAVLLGVGLWPLQAWEPGIGRIGRAGLYLCNRIVCRLRADGYCRHVSVALTRRFPDIFVCFGLGLLFSVIGPILLGSGLRHVGGWGLFGSFPLPLLWAQLG
jgi:hypothetical protein